MVLRTPERIDTLLAERAAQPVTDRLHVLATQDPLERGARPSGRKWPRSAAEGVAAPLQLHRRRTCRSGRCR